jgi:hypothetical protein
MDNRTKIIAPKLEGIFELEEEGVYDSLSSPFVVAMASPSVS